MFVVLLFLCTIISIFYFATKKFNYWAKKKVPHLKPVPFLGNYGEFILLRTSVANVLKKICDKFPEEPYIGSFYGTEPALIVQDPELIKIILTKDFYYFNGRESSDYNEREPSTKDIFYSHGDKWKVFRQNLTPLYTAAKIKNMFPLIEKCCRAFETLLKEETRTTKNIKANRLMARFTLDVFGSVTFGIETQVMQKDFETNPFKIMNDRIFEHSTHRGIKNICRGIWPSIFYGLGFHLYRRDINTFFGNILNDVFQQRDYKPSKRNDFVDLILGFFNNDYLVGESIKRSKSGEYEKISIKINKELLAAQCLSVLGAGNETSSNTLVMTLFELAKNKDVQEKVFEEVDEYLNHHDDVLDYDCVSKLPYLEACIDEALRFYPSLPNLTREVMEDYTFPTGLRVEKGVHIHIPLMHIHRNACHYPRPDEYRPERFLPEEKHKIKPYTYLPFGDGFRICIGARFAKMLMLAGLVTIFKSYEVQLAEGQSPTVEFDPRVFVNRSKHDIYLKFIPRKNGRYYRNLENK